MSGNLIFSSIAALFVLGMTADCVAAAEGADVRLTTQGAAERLLPGVVSREHRELHVATHPTGKVTLWGCEDCPRGRGKDLWMTQKQSEAWSAPGRAPMSLPDDEAAPAFSADGVWLYFVSNRRGGFGAADLYRAAYASHREEFATVENLGPGINSSGDEGAATATAGGNRVIFASRGRKGARGWDLFESQRKDGRMTPAAPIASLNTAADEFDPALLADEAGLVFARTEGNSPGSTSLWFAPRKGEGFGEAVRLGEAINARGRSARAPAQDLTDPERLLFTRSESATVGATTDVYTIRYRIEPSKEAPRAADDR